MKTLVIHINDPSTDFLKPIYENIEDCTVINDGYYSKSHLRELVKIHDKIIMLGHGCPTGLFGNRGLIIDSSFVDVLKDKDNVYIWCHANKFVEAHNLKGFSTGMMISEWTEALVYGIMSSDKQIYESNKLFSEVIKESLSIKDKKLMLENIKDKYVLFDNPVCDFNNTSTFIYE